MHSSELNGEGLNGFKLGVVFRERGGESVLSSEISRLVTPAMQFPT